MKSSYAALAFFVTVYQPLEAASPPCYSPNGHTLPNYGVCDPRLAASLCCGSGDVCYPMDSVRTQLRISIVADVLTNNINPDFALLFA